MKAAAEERPLRVLMLIDHLDAGGAQSLLVDLVAGMDRSRFRPLVCALRASSIHVPRLQSLGVPVFDLGAGRFDPRKFFRLLALVRRHRPHIVHAHLSASGVLAGLVSICGGFRLILHDHSGEEFLRKHAALALWLLYPLERLLMRRTRVLIAVSGDTARFARCVKGLPGERIRVVHNGIDSGSFGGDRQQERLAWRRAWGIAEDAFVVGAAGRLSPQKGFRHLVEAAPAILAAAPGARFLVAGRGAEEARLKALARRLGVEQAFCFAGYHEQMGPAYAAMDLFVLPSVYEPFGLVVLEAQACGLPVIASAVGGVPEIIESGANGVLVPPGDPARLAEAVLWLMKSPGQARRLAEKGRQGVSRFDLALTLREIQGVYEEVVREN